MKDPFQNRRMRLALQYLFLQLGIQVFVGVEASSGKWDVMNCNRAEVSWGDDEAILLDAKRPLDKEQCIAIKDMDFGDYKSYAIKVDLWSLESAKGQNSGHVGLIFNYLDHENYDFIYLEIHDMIPTVPTFNPGYCVNGEYFYDEKVVIDQTVDGSGFHSLTLVVDNDPDVLTKVLLDGSLVGTFQEHFVPRLKGGVFVIEKFGSVGLFKNFNIGNEVLYKRFEGTDIPTYAADCNLIPSNALYIKIVMGSVVDYFKPVEGKTYCEMLQSDELHLWSSDGKNWRQPGYYGRFWGGSAINWPKSIDGRRYLTFWGGNAVNTGGCCFVEIGGAQSWGRAFDIFYGMA